MGIAEERPRILTPSKAPPLGIAEGQPPLAGARLFLASAAVLGGSAVGIGAFGHHILRGVLSEQALDILAIGTRYQMYHALALLATATILTVRPSETSISLQVAGYSFIAGTVLFSGSVYLSALGLSGWWGAIAPLGGAGLLAGWGCLLLAAWQGR